ncbi:hypothetical protein SAMN05216404_101219 [Nitrosospira multiformis]|uniref:Plasmid segregation centromere-binding protein ParG n=1 Tax=Nitrosospira multiformis TaxID=1231 RepID=A0A1H8BDW3_9PROT|nr:hypothetical protein [Nitrosospira multiformis]SEM81065.1 hypothetical protein SAMN05216404_101219 [Nitrosospira multiformis]
MTKKISFEPKPSKPLPPAADNWVESRTPTDAPPAVTQPTPTLEQAIQEKPVPRKTKQATANESERMKRLTIDIPLSLHRAIKMQCAGRDTKIAEEIRELLLKKYGKS